MNRHPILQIIVVLGIIATITWLVHRGWSRATPAYAPSPDTLAMTLNDFYEELNLDTLLDDYASEDLLGSLGPEITATVSRIASALQHEATADEKKQLESSVVQLRTQVNGLASTIGDLRQKRERLKAFIKQDLATVHDASDLFEKPIFTWPELALSFALGILSSAAYDWLKMLFLLRIKGANNRLHRTRSPERRNEP